VPVNCGSLISVRPIEWGIFAAVMAKSCLRLLLMGSVYWLCMFRLTFGQSFGELVDVVEPVVTSFKSVNLGSQLARSGEREVIAGWRSTRKGVPYNQIYLQKIDNSGQLLWELDGVPICPWPANQTNFSMREDGYGGVVVVWEDYREGPESPRLFMQRVNMSGELMWGKSGIMVCTDKSGQRKPEIISDLEGGFYVVWEDLRGGLDEPDIYSQFIDLGGRLRWKSEGLPLAFASGAQQNFSLATDDKHFLYVVWEDFRNGLYWNLHGQKVDQSGITQWKSGGLDFFAGVEESHHNPEIVPDGYGGLLLVYQKYSQETHGTDIYRCRINSGGELVFHFATCYANEEQQNPRIVKKGSKALVCWEDRRNGSWDIYAQMVRLHDGILEWEINGVPVASTTADEQEPVVIAASSYGYQVFGWVRKSREGNQICAQKLTNLGEKSWLETGVVVNPNNKDQVDVSILPDESGGLWCAWTEKQEGGSLVVTQHMNSNCLPLLNPKGILLGAQHERVFAQFEQLALTTTKTGESFLAWQDDRNGIQNQDIYLQKLDARGKPVWRSHGIPVCQAAGEQSFPVLIEDGVGGVILAWYDKRDGSSGSIFAQRIDSDGRFLWARDGVPVCQEMGGQNGLRMVTDGDEGAILCWVDFRNLSSTGFDLYAQRVRHDGSRAWVSNGIPVANFNGIQTNPTLLSDGQGGVYVVWQDGRQELSSIFVQRINSTGLNVWEFGGKPTVSASSGFQRAPSASINNQSELNVVWEESNSEGGNSRVMMQKHTSNGGRMWSSSGIAVDASARSHQNVKVFQAGAGDFWVFWLEEQLGYGGGSNFFGKRFDLSGASTGGSSKLNLAVGLTGWVNYEGVPFKNGCFLLAWPVSASEGKSHVQCQIIDPAGQLRYGPLGHSFLNKYSRQFEPQLIVEENGEGAILIFSEESLLDKSYRIKSCKIK